MTLEEMFALAQKLLKTPGEIALKCETVDEGTLYVYEDCMGGRSLMVGADGAVLFADSSISFDEHLQAYREGLRTPPEDYDA